MSLLISDREEVGEPGGRAMKSKKSKKSGTPRKIPHIVPVFSNDFALG